MKIKILVGVIVALSISGIALSDSLIPESGDSYIERNIKEMNREASIIWNQAQSKLDPNANDIDRLRLKQVAQHLKNAKNYKNSFVFTVADKEIEYATSLIQLPKSENEIGQL